MVCRENKARSAHMGFVKHQLRDAGYGDVSDSEVQSWIHAYRHRFAGAPDPGPAEYVAELKGFRQMILNDPSIGEGDKFRPSTGRGGQPGLITRIDEELERFRTGQDEKGRPLTSAQQNLGRDFAAMARLTAGLGRSQEAKQAYCEVYARHLGITTSEAMQRYRQLVDRKMTDRLNTKISLTDDWQEKLAVSGITTKMQADMGQSNQHREALRIMEAERQAKLRSLPTRAAVREPTMEVLSPDDPRVAIRCDLCGQFGHTTNDGVCPYGDLEGDLDAAVTEVTDKFAEVDEMSRCAKARELQLMINEGHLDDWQMRDTQDQPVWLSPSTGEVLPIDDPSVRTEVAEMSERYDLNELKRLSAEMKQAREKAGLANAALVEARGPIPQVSSYIKELSYNPESGLALVTTRGYTLKRSGEERPPKTYLRRMSPEQYAQLESDPRGISSAVSNSLFARAAQGGNARYKFENADEEREALVQRQCPSCGQWASMTSMHSCPIPGSADEAEEPFYRQHLSEARERAKVAGLPVRMQENMKRHLVARQATGLLSGEGRLVFPHPQEMLQTADSGKVGIGRFTGEYFGAQVTGRVYVWRDRLSGSTLYRIDTMKCSCGRVDCRHVDRAASSLHGPYGATRAYGSPGAPDLTGLSRPAAQDAAKVPVARASFEEIRAMRAENVEAYKREFAVKAPLRRGVVAAPLGPDGRPVQESDVPRRWSVGDGRAVDLEDTPQVVSEIQQRLDVSTGRTERSNWRVTADNAGGVWVRSVEAAGSGDREVRMYGSNQAALQKAFGMPSRPGGRGVYIPAGRAWRSEMLDRLSGREVTYRGPRFVQSVDDTTDASTRVEHDGSQG